MKRIEVTRFPDPSIHRDPGAETISVFVSEPGTDADNMTEIVLPYLLAYKIYQGLERVL